MKTVLGETVLGETVSPARVARRWRSTFLEDASSALSSAVLATMTRAVRDDVVARLRREETGANALADANAHTRTAIRASWDQAIGAWSGTQDLGSRTTLELGTRIEKENCGLVRPLARTLSGQVWASGCLLWFVGGW